MVSMSLNSIAYQVLVTSYNDEHKITELLFISDERIKNGHHGMVEMEKIQ
jgi:hypothetical protein